MCAFGVCGCLRPPSLNAMWTCVDDQCGLHEAEERSFASDMRRDNRTIGQYPPFATDSFAVG